MGVLCLRCCSEPMGLLFCSECERILFPQCLPLLPQNAATLVLLMFLSVRVGVTARCRTNEYSMTNELPNCFRVCSGPASLGVLEGMLSRPTYCMERQQRTS